MTELQEKLKSLGFEDKDSGNLSEALKFVIEKSATEADSKIKKELETAQKALTDKLAEVEKFAKETADKVDTQKSEEVSLGVADAIEKAFKDNVIDSIEKVKQFASEGKVIALKADNPITNASLTGNYSRTQQVSGVRFAPVRDFAFLNRGIKVGTVASGKNLILWTPGSFTGNVAYIGELSDATTTVDGSTISAVEKSRKLSKLIARGVLSKESLEDIPQLAARAQMKTVEAAELWLDQEIWNGVGSAINDEKVYGIIPDQSTPFDATGIPKVKSPNVADLADAAKLQAKKNKHSGNTVWMSASLSFKLQHTKDKNDNYIINKLVDGTLVMGGYTVIENEDMFGGATEKMLIGDPAKIQLWVKRGLELEFERIPKTDSFNYYIYGRQQVLVEDEDIKGLIYIEDVETALDLIAESVN